MLLGRGARGVERLIECRESFILLCSIGRTPGLRFATMADPAKTAQFVAVTGVSEDAAIFYLDSSSGDVETAINQFYATGGIQEAPEASAEDFMDAPEESQPG